MLLLHLSIVFLLILLNGFFAMAEIALVSARPARLQPLLQTPEPGPGVSDDALANRRQHPGVQRASRCRMVLDYQVRDLDRVCAARPLHQVIEVPGDLRAIDQQSDFELSLR